MTDAATETGRTIEHSTSVSSKERIDALLNVVSVLLAKAQDGTLPELATAVEKASVALRIPSDLEKSQADIQKSQAELYKLSLEDKKLLNEIGSAQKRERSENRKEYVTLLTPIVTIFTLAATLIFQGWQFSQSERDKREASEDAQWADAIKTISQNDKLTPTVIALNPFLKSPRYTELARATALQLLANSNDQNTFTDLFGAVFVPVGWNNIDQLVKLNRALLARERPLRDRTYDSKKDTNDDTKLTPQEHATWNYVLGAQRSICSQAASVLNRPRPSGANLDFSGVSFFDCDCSGIDLKGANLERAELSWVDLKGAELSDIRHFDGLYVYHADWWDAKSISPQLLEFLEKDHTSQYREGAEYGPKSVKFTKEQYEANIARLKGQVP